MSPLFGSRAGREAASAGREDLDGPSPNGAAPGVSPGGLSTLAASRPEIALAAAFAGGIALAILVRRLGS
jgi:hypothetical protein